MPTAGQQNTLLDSLELPELLSYIDGGIEVSLQDRNNDLRNPNDGESLQAQLSCTPEQVERALASSDAAQYIREGHLSQRLPGKMGEVEYFRSPWGPALLVSPWNGPTAIGSHKIASALAAGAPCIMKPSE